MSLFVMQNELDEVVRTWKTHRIKPRPGQGFPTVHPVLMFSLPEMYCSTEDKLKPVLPEEIAAPQMGSTPVFELCVLLMEDKRLTAPVNPYHAPELYTL